MARGGSNLTPMQFPKMYFLQRERERERKREREGQTERDRETVTEITIFIDFLGFLTFP